MSEQRPYNLVRSMVENWGGLMTYVREGRRYGAWEIKIGDRLISIEAKGTRSFPELDNLYVPRVRDPKTWDDYQDILVADAHRKLIAMFGYSWPDAQEEEVLKQTIERTKWKFAWTYARTYPHEYTTKMLSTPQDHKELIECIEQFGFTERFGDSHRKYFYFEDRKYWHMGDPSSKDPEKRPNVINRTWVDVRRHAANVIHRWTPEEVELQQRLWEIQLEKTTDRPKRK